MRATKGHDLNAAPRVAKPPAHGGFSDKGRLRIAVTFDSNTFARIGALADKNEISFGAQVRWLVKVGLDAGRPA